VVIFLYFFLCFIYFIFILYLFYVLFVFYLYYYLYYYFYLYYDIYTYKTILQGIKNALPNANITYNKGCNLLDSPENFTKIAENIKGSEVIIYVGGISSKLEGEEKRVRFFFFIIFYFYFFFKMLMVLKEVIVQILKFQRSNVNWCRT
jgi:hypothetical protein